ncbi:hypothetical protein DFR52_1111 [Hoeflea marina]|uniref:2'-5' RNA ligase n=1 Tax=Hoeflea marina TaxID=274592 RepID=A0A317PEJ2_9HYPH|nr:2'-5' RNA ligase family protein [Hoeflea marina]PWV95370.1 hypothetical protein DFR52_1111 [Hoeflea marina]
MKHCHSIWLMPSDPDHAMLSRIVGRLADEFGTQRFSPHLTLVEDMGRPADELAALLDRDFSGRAAFEAPVAAVSGLPLFFRSLFAAFAAEGPLLELKRTAVTTFGRGDIDSFLPHISLAYGVTEEKKPPAIARLNAELAGRTIRFDSIVVAASGQEIPIEDWAIAARLRLG